MKQYFLRNITFYYLWPFRLWGHWEHAPCPHTPLPRSRSAPILCEQPYLRPPPRISALSHRYWVHVNLPLYPLQDEVGSHNSTASAARRCWWRLSEMLSIAYYYNAIDITAIIVIIISIVSQKNSRQCNKGRSTITCTGWLKKSKPLTQYNSLLFLSHPVYTVNCKKKSRHCVDSL